MRFERFATLADMNRRAAAFQGCCDSLVAVEPAIYTDNNGLSYRPAVTLYSPEGAFEPVNLRWNAMTSGWPGEETLDHMGRRARVNARDHAEWLTNYIQETINHINR